MNFGGMFRVRLRGSASARVLAMGLAAGINGGAIAQDASGTPAGTGATPRTNNGLEEIVVSATKEATAVDLDKVPISISAYSQQDMDTSGIRTIGDIANITPGLTFSLMNTVATSLSNIEIRGVQSRTSAPTTGIYLDDTSMADRANNVNGSANGAFPQVFDLDRVEVLRGPQGTLFGASSEGGAVRFITNQPSLSTWSEYGRMELSGTDGGDPSYEAGAAVGGPIVDGVLGFRMSAWYRRDGGWIDRVEPPVGERVTLFNVIPITPPGTPLINPNAPGGRVIDANANWSDTASTKLAFAWKPNDWLLVTPQVFYQWTYNHDSPDYDLSLSDPASGKFNVAHSQQLASEDPFVIPELKLEAQWGDVQASSISSYFWRRLKFQTDFTQYQDNAFFGNPWLLTGLPDDFATGEYGVFQNKVIQEFRLANVDPNDALTWVAGVYFESAHQSDQAYVEHPDLPALVLKYTGLPIQDILGSPPYLGRWVAYDAVTTDDQQVAMFGNLDYRVVDGLKLTVGGRWAHATSDTSLVFDGPFNGGHGQFVGTETDEPFTPKFGVTWQPDEHSTYYATVAEGYRVGGVNPQTNNSQPTCQAALAADGLSGKLLQTYQPDSLWSYEVGAKDRLLSNRLEIQVSAYHVDWNNIQEAIPIQNCGFGVIFNLGAAETNGFDLALNARVTDNLKIGIDTGYTDAHYDTTVKNLVRAGEEVGGPSISNGEAPPPWTLTLTAEYDTTLLDNDVYFWAEDVFHSKNNGPFSTQNATNIIDYDPSLQADPTTNVINLRAGVLLGHFDVSLFADNVLNNHVDLSYSHTNPGDPRYAAITFRPLTVGLTATYKY